jgi:hypothetical protein
VAECVGSAFVVLGAKDWRRCIAERSLRRRLYIDEGVTRQRSLSIIAGVRSQPVYVSPPSFSSMSSNSVFYCKFQFAVVTSWSQCVRQRRGATGIIRCDGAALALVDEAANTEREMMKHNA